MIERKISSILQDWKKAAKSKPLLLRGARQVGKTYAVRQLGKSFPNYLEVNLEEAREIHSFFEGRLDPQQICEKLSNYYGVRVIPGATLLFLDEAQACPRALSSLRFFYEKMPELHVVAAGSLLEFALQELPSQGVGRISSLFMHPVTFEEFAMATGEEGSWKVAQKASPDQPLDEAFHRRLVDALKTYLMIGGMPEVVQAYSDTRDLRACQDILSDLIATFRDDFAKYKARAPTLIMGETLQSICRQAGSKFKYSYVDHDSASQTIKNALELLAQSGLALKAYHSDSRGLPLGAEINPKKFKAILLDVGLHQRILGTDISKLMAAKRLDVINKGALAEAFVGQELVAAQPSRSPASLYYWHREARSSNAEVDYVASKGEEIIPIEVKAGGKGSMQSIRLFMKERGLQRGVRASLENFGKLDEIDIIPLYAVGEYFRER